MDITDIPDAELLTYIKRLIPMLLKKSVESGPLSVLLPMTLIGSSI